jgi:hypothetical protein
MFKKMLIILLMVPVVMAAGVTGTSLPILIFMAGLIIAALAVSSAREDGQG